ncbi:MAG: hypothetical protein ACM3TT_11235 [Syntrophothermus sp.]
MSARYHLLLRSLEGAFVSYWPQKRVFLERKAVGEDHAAFEVALCRECGQHYLVGRVKDGKLVEAIRDPGDLKFGAAFFRPLEDKDDGEEEGEGDGLARKGKKELFRLCVRCGEIGKGELKCGHRGSIQVVKEPSPEDEDRLAWLEKKENLRACLEAAQKRVSGNCGCDGNTSCYGCLRSYRNQFAHQYLKRGPVMHYLERILSEWGSQFTDLLHG